MSRALAVAIDRYSALVLRYGHKEAKAIALGSVLADCVRPGVKRNGLLTGEEE